jgi:nitrogen fixation NifU-like protein
VSLGAMGMRELEELYREIVLDHYRSPRNRGELASPPAHRVEGFNPLCGDEVVVTMLLGDDDAASFEQRSLSDIKIGGTGCSISQASASLMSAAVKGRPVAEARSLIATFKGMMSVHETSLGEDGGDGEHGDRANGLGNGLSPGPETVEGEPEPIDVNSLGELAALQGVVKFPVRIKCATLSWNALAQALRELEAAGSGA